MLETLQSVYAEAKGVVTWRNVATYSVIALLTWLLYRLIIEPYLSHLRKIPGLPRTSIFMGNMKEIFKGEPVDPIVNWVKEMKSGFFRYHHVLGEQRILVADADIMKHILITRAKNYEKPAFLYRILENFTGRGLLNLIGKEHIMQRKLCMLSFKMAVLQNMIPTMQKHTEELIGLWKSQIENDPKIQLEVGEDLQRMTMDTISDCAFGYNTNALLDPNNPLTKALGFMLMELKPKLFRILFPTHYSKLPIKSNRDYKKYKKQTDELIKDVIESKRAHLKESDESKFTDLLSVLLLARDTETDQQLSSQQLRDHVMTFMIAGHETTSTQLSWTLHCLANRQDIQAKVREELTSVLPPKGEMVTFDHLEKLTYLTAVLKETQRLYPSIGMTFRQAVNDDVINGYFIPAGTVFNLSMGAMQRSPLIWDDPEEFKPERFLNEEDIRPYSYLPFLAGSRICIGKKFAMIEMKTVLALLLQEFTFSPVPDITYKKRQFVTIRLDPMLKLTAESV